MPQSIILLCDDKPGHFHSAEGVAAAVQLIAPFGIHRVEVRRPAYAPPDLLSWLTNRHTPPGVILKAIYGLEAAKLPAASLVVSAGGDTLAANIALARLQGIPNIFYGSIRRYRIEDFTLVLNSQPERTAHPREVQFMKPSARDPFSIPPARGADGDQPLRLALLVGGNSGTVTFQDADWDRLVAFLRACKERHGFKFVVSNSRRTPPSFSDRLASVATETDSPIARFIDVRHVGAGTLLELFSDCDAVIATTDSSSMISEAIWMRRPVIAVAPERSRHLDREARYRAYLEARGWCREIPLTSLDARHVRNLLASLTPQDENPQAELAGLLKRHLPQLCSTEELGEGEPSP